MLKIFQQSTVRQENILGLPEMLILGDENGIWGCEWDWAI